MDLGWALHVRASTAAAAMCSTVGATLVGLIAGNTTPPAAIYRGACDASAAVAVDADHFAVADDEDPSNTLRVYRFGEPRPVSTTPTSAFLSAGAEVDIEGAEQIGDLIYWIGSHARTSKNKASPDRRRLFATRLSYHGRTPVLTPTGIPYDHLLEDFANARRSRISASPTR